jgi:hypothetical protein
MHARLLPALAATAVLGAPMVAAVQSTDKQSVSVTVSGCLKGRDLHVVELLESDDEKRAALVQGKRFRLSGKGSVKDDIRRHDGQFVKVSGLVKKTVLDQPGITVGRTRIVIGASPMSRDPTTNAAMDPSERLLPMDATAITSLAEKCFR